MGPSPTYHLPDGEECETSVEHGLPAQAESAAGYCSRRPRPSPMWGSRFVGARALGPWVGEQKLLGKISLWGNPSPACRAFGEGERPGPRVALPISWWCGGLSKVGHSPCPGWSSLWHAVGVCCPCSPGVGGPREEARHRHHGARSCELAMRCGGGSREFPGRVPRAFVRVV